MNQTLASAIENLCTHTLRCVYVWARTLNPHEVDIYLCLFCFLFLFFSSRLTLFALALLCCFSLYTEANRPTTFYDECILNGMSGKIHINILSNWIIQHQSVANLLYELKVICTESDGSRFLNCESISVFFFFSFYAPF